MENNPRQKLIILRIIKKHQAGAIMQKWTILNGKPHRWDGSIIWGDLDIYWSNDILMPRLTNFLNRLFISRNSNYTESRLKNKIERYNSLNNTSIDYKLFIKHPICWRPGLGAIGDMARGIVKTRRHGRRRHKID